MPYAVARTGKLKTSTKMASASGHNDRTIDVPNARPDGEHYAIIDNSEGRSLDKHVQELKGKASHRKDAIGALEVLLSASPEYFRPDTPELKGVYDKERMDAWLAKTTEFIKSEYGDGVIHKASIHLDEATPHIHIEFIPCYSKTKKKRRTKAQIAAKEESATYEQLTFDAQKWQGRDYLVGMHDRYAEALKPLGIDRGLRASKAEHETQNKYNARVNAPLDIESPKLEWTRQKKGESMADSVRRNFSKNLRSLRDKVVLSSKLAEQWRLEALRSKAAAAGYSGLPPKAEYQSRLNTLEAAERASEKALERTESAERENNELRQDFDKAVATEVRKQLPAEVVKHYEDRKLRIELMKEHVHGISTEEEARGDFRP